MKFNFLFKTICLGLTIVLFASCDKDFNELGSDLVQDDHYQFTKDVTKTVIAYNQKIGPVQTSDLPINALGYYNSPVFGKTKASYVTQVEMNTLNPTFKSHVVIDSVYLYIPYFSTFLEKDNATGDTTYELDSIQGSSKFDLKIYENGYFLRDYDPSSPSGLTERQKYYSDQTPQFFAAIGNGGEKLNNSLIQTGQNTDFAFSPAEVKFTYLKDSETIVKERKTPGMSILLDKTFFMNKIFNAPAGKLVNNNVFKDYFRGLYFKAGEFGGSATQGAMSLLNFAKGTIIISFHQDKVISVNQAPDADRERKTFQLNLSGNSVNLYENDNNAAFESAITAPQTGDGHERLYLRGQEGAAAVVSLFGTQDSKGYDADGILVNTPNGVADELDDLRNPTDGKKWLINEASLSFYIDRTAMQNSPEPNRILLYDYTNKRPILDYYSDNTTSGVSAKYHKLVFGGIIEKEKVTNGFGKGIKYKVRITNHIRSLIKNSDSTNVKLGLVVTENIAQVTNQKIRNPASALFNKIPTASVMNPKGTVIYGTPNTSNVPADKRLKLEIYYTKPD